MFKRITASFEKSISGIGAQQLIVFAYAFFCWAFVGKHFVFEELDCVNFMLATQSMSGRSYLISRLKAEVEMLEQEISANRPVDHARAPVLDRVVDVDYFLRKLALSFGLTVEDRKRRTMEKTADRH